jgi:hypothetical protein
MSLLRDVKLDKKTAMIYGISDKRISPAFEFESERDKIRLELTDFQLMQDSFIIGRKCENPLLYGLFAEFPTICIDDILNSLEPKSLSVEFDFREPKERTISDIKKEIKHEKNPLRLKQLNKELNAKYKELKSGRK